MCTKQEKIYQYKNMKKSKTASRPTLFNSTLRKFDLFSTDVSFRENGNETLTTNFGALISLLILALVFTYSVKKCKILIDREDSSFSEYLEEYGDIDNEILGFDQTEFFPAFTIWDSSVGFFP